MSGKGSAAWVEAPADCVGDAIVAAMTAGGIDHLFFTSGSEIAFYQEATAKARAHGDNRTPRLITVPHEHARLNAALGFAAVSGRPAGATRADICGCRRPTTRTESFATTQSGTIGSRARTTRA